MITALLATPAVFAAPIACTTATVDVYISQTEGCTLGIFTIKNFAWSSVGDEGYVPVSATSVLVTPTVTSDSVAVGFTSGAFSVSGNDKILAFLDYTIDPPPPILDDLNLEMEANTPVPPGYARITANICIGGLFSNSCAGGLVRTLIVQNFGAGNPSNIPFDSEQFPEPVNLIDIRTTIELNANGASSQITGYGTTTTATDGSVVSDELPEPGTAALCSPAWQEHSSFDAESVLDRSSANRRRYVSG